MSPGNLLFNPPSYARISKTTGGEKVWHSRARAVGGIWDSFDLSFGLEIHYIPQEL